MTISDGEQRLVTNDGVKCKALYIDVQGYALLQMGMDVAQRRGGRDALLDVTRRRRGVARNAGGGRGNGRKRTIGRILRQGLQVENREDLVLAKGEEVNAQNWGIVRVPRVDYAVENLHDVGTQ